MSTLVRLICADWQAGRIMWPDAVAALGQAGLPQLYAAAYHAGVETRRRFADEVRLPDLAQRYELTPTIWRANPVWQNHWSAEFERRWRHSPGQALRTADEFERGVGWMEYAVRADERRRRDIERQRREDAELHDWIASLRLAAATEVVMEILDRVPDVPPDPGDELQGRSIANDEAVQKS